MSARSCDRIRSARSAESCDIIRIHQGPVTRPIPITVTTTANSPSRTAVKSARASASTPPAITSAAPAARRTRPSRLLPPASSEVRDSARSRARSGSEACRQISAPPRQASRIGRNRPPCGSDVAAMPTDATAATPAIAYSSQTGSRPRPASGAVGSTIR